jgi:ribonuclease HII
MLLKFFKDASILEVGIDEAGRGPLLGRVYAAAVIWNQEISDSDIPDIKDSKKLSEKKRNELRKWIEQNLDYGVGFAEPEEIDEINILEATYLAMHRAIDNLNKKPDYILVDGNRFKKYKNIDYQCITKGDDKYYSIAAASILAKVYHDEYIYELCKNNSYLDNRYKLKNNKGYGTKAHIEGIQNYGITQFHRKTFKKCI